MLGWEMKDNIDVLSRMRNLECELWKYE